MNKNLKFLKAARIFCVLCLLGLGLAPARAIANSYIVTNTNDRGAGSIRAAINIANSNPGTVITFRIATTDPRFSEGIFTIKPTTALPTITANGTVIDGSTQASFSGNTNPAGPEVVLNGSLAPSYLVSGLVITASNCVVKGLVINNFGSQSPYNSTGVVIGGATATGNTIKGCYIGTDATGTVAAPNGYYGIVINRAKNNIIGGVTAEARNIISGNRDGGIIITGPASDDPALSAYGNVVVYPRDVGG